MAYGSSVKPQFETLSYSSYETDTCLIRENTSSLSVKHQSQVTGPVDKADKTIQEPSSLGPSSMAIARPSIAQNGDEAQPASLPSTADEVHQVCDVKTIHTFVYGTYHYLTV